MASESTKPLNDGIALAGKSSDKGSNIDSLPERIERYNKAKRRASLNIQYLDDSVDYTADETGYLLKRLKSCSNWLVFRNYFTLGETRLVRASFCMKHLMCPLCAIRRASKSLGAYLDRFEQIRKEYPNHEPHLLTLTVTNGSDLSERFEHLVQSWKTYQNRRRTYFKNGRGYNELCKVDGAVFSYELTKSEKGWHPHMHAIVMVEKGNEIDFDNFSTGYQKSQSKLSQEWFAITGDSSIVDCRPIDMEDPTKSFSEVFKYALKFSDLNPEDNYQAYKVLNKRRLQGSFGLFRGVKVPEKLTDELLTDELPYIELFYRYTSAGFSVVDTHTHDGTPIKETTCKKGQSLEERTEKALNKTIEYKKSRWWKNDDTDLRGVAEAERTTSKEVEDKNERSGDRNRLKRRGAPT